MWHPPIAKTHGASHCRVVAPPGSRKGSCSVVVVATVAWRVHRSDNSLALTARALVQVVLKRTKALAKGAWNLERPVNARG